MHRSSHSPARLTNTQGGGVHAVQELLRFLTSTREAQEIEHKRRLAWEQEQEAKYNLRQAEMERRMLEMQQEITTLKSRVTFSSPASSSSSAVHAHSNTVVSQHPQLAYPPFVSPPQQPTPRTSPTLSHTSTHSTLSSPLVVGQPVAGPSTDHVLGAAAGSTFVSPSLPPTRFVNVNPSGLRNMSAARSDSEEADDDRLPAQHRVRRKNHHDTRCLTIQVIATRFQMMSSLTLYGLSSTPCATIYCVL